jgi:ferredoxin
MAATALMVWIDQDLCTGDGICSEICPDVFVGRDDGLWVVKEEASHFGATIVFDGADGPVTAPTAAAVSPAFPTRRSNSPWMPPRSALASAS